MASIPFPVVNPRSTLAAAVLAACLPTFADAAVYQYGVTRVMNYTQTSTSAPAAAQYWSMYAYTYVDVPNEIVGATVTYDAPPVTRTLSQATPTLHLFSSDYYTTAAEFDAAYPGTTYQFDVDTGGGPQSGSVAVPADMFCAAVPYLTGDTYDRLQNLDTTQTFNGTINGFTPTLGTDTASCSISIVRGTGVDAVTVLSLTLLPGDTAFEVPAGLLLPDTFHSIGVSYVNSAVTPNAGFGTATATADYVRGTGAYFTTRPSGPTLTGTGANTFTDNTGNGNSNGRIDPGETSILLQVPVRNDGNSAATGVTATLSTTTPTVSIVSATSAYPDLAASGGTGSNISDYVLSVSPDHPCGAPIALTLDITAASGSGSYGFALATGRPGQAGPFTTPYTGPAVPIPDNNATGVFADVVVSGLTGAVSDVNLRFDGTVCSDDWYSPYVGLDHAFIGDVVMTLHSPAGTTVTLMSRNGSSGRNLCGTVFDDQAATPVTSIRGPDAPYTGSYIPIAPLAALNGESPNGTWRLRVADLSQYDTGNIRAFSLLLSTEDPTNPVCDPPASGCGSADFNCDGDIGTDADIEGFFACLAGACPEPPCASSADFNADGDIGTDSDIEAFFRVLAGGNC